MKRDSDAEVRDVDHVARTRGARDRRGLAALWPRRRDAWSVDRQSGRTRRRIDAFALCFSPVRASPGACQQAYAVCSVAVDLRVSELVDVPSFVVSALLPLEVFD